jgi:hypothetical protein
MHERGKHTTRSLAFSVLTPSLPSQNNDEHWRALLTAKVLSRPIQEPSVAEKARLERLEHEAKEWLRYNVPGKWNGWKLEKPPVKSEKVHDNNQSQPYHSDTGIKEIHQSDSQISATGHRHGRSNLSRTSMESTSKPSPTANGNGASVPVAESSFANDFTPAKMMKTSLSDMYPDHRSHRHSSYTFSEATDDSQMNHWTEFRKLENEMLEAARFRPEKRELFRTLDMRAFEGEVNNEVVTSSPSVPDCLPSHRHVNGFGEMGTYMTNASYVVSLGGPPLPDMKYGIIIVPIGEERLLFSGRQDSDYLPRAFRDEVIHESRAMRVNQAVDDPQPVQSGRGDARVFGDWDQDDQKFYRQRRLQRKHELRQMYRLGSSSS